MTNILQFIPLILATLALIITSFSKSKRKKEWLIVSFVIWLMVFVSTLVYIGVF